MPAKIRLARRGRRKRPYYHIVIADVRAPRDGKFIEHIGSYNPMTKPATIDLDRDKAYDWLMKGAQPTETVRAILRFKGVLYKKHLQRGVAKGALTQEQADKKLQEWIDAKEAKVAARFEETRKEREDFLKMLSGVAKPPKAKAAAEEDAAPFREEGDANASEAPAVEEAPVVEEVPVAEEAPAAQEAPVADDLKKIEGIGPKIAETLSAAGIATFAKLSETPADKIKEVLTAAGSQFATHDPTTWPQQAKMAANGEWDALKKWQDELDGGKVAETKTEEE